MVFKMKVSLVSYSQPNNPSLNNIQDLIAFCARVSNPDNQYNPDNNKLIKYLINNKHFSPLEMVNICLEIETTRDIARQILRHRSFSFQEFSQRYADPTKGLGFELREARLQDTKNRQNSIKTADRDLKEDWNMKQMELMNLAKKHYEWAVGNGIAKEQARVILPEGNTVSRLYMNGNLRSWLHYCELRTANGTQLEHMLVARECVEAISTVFPMIKEVIKHDN